MRRRFVTKLRVSKRTNFLSTANAARAYVARHRSEEHTDRLIQGADVGLYFAFSMKRIIELEKWFSSSRNQRWLGSTGGQSVAEWNRYFLGQVDDANALTVPAGNITSLAGQLLVCAQQVFDLSSSLIARFEANPRAREVVIACGKELNMVAGFATRTARQAGMKELTASELAAISLYVGAESHSSTLDEMDRRVDKFRKIVEALPGIEATLDEMESLS